MAAFGALDSIQYSVDVLKGSIKDFEDGARGEMAKEAIQILSEVAMELQNKAVHDTAYTLKILATVFGDLTISKWFILFDFLQQ